MRKRHFASWVAGLKLIHPILLTSAGILAIVSAGMATAGGISVKVIRSIVREENEPIRDMAEYNLKASGHWDEYIREREKAERDRKVIDSRRAAGPYPIYRRPE